jgi:hypothetical protein
MSDGLFLFPMSVIVSPQATMYMTRNGLLTWEQYELPRRARRYAVLNRNVWWHRPAMLHLDAATDGAAADALIRASVPA